jgi:hypothetical protein
MVYPFHKGNNSKTLEDTIHLHHLATTHSQLLQAMDRPQIPTANNNRQAPLVASLISSLPSTNHNQPIKCSISLKIQDISCNKTIHLVTKKDITRLDQLSPNRISALTHQISNMVVNLLIWTCTIKINPKTCMEISKLQNNR